MTPEKIRHLAAKYHSQLTEVGIAPSRINPNDSFRYKTPKELFAHALYLCQRIMTMDIKNNYGKANRHLAAAQMCLSFAGWYTLNQLRKHNRE